MLAFSEPRGGALSLLLMISCAATRHLQMTVRVTQTRLQPQFLTAVTPRSLATHSLKTQTRTQTRTHTLHALNLHQPPYPPNRHITFASVTRHRITNRHIRQSVTIPSQASPDTLPPTACATRRHHARPVDHTARAADQHCGIRKSLVRPVGDWADFRS